MLYTITNRNICLSNRIYIISAVTEKSFNVEKEEEIEAEAEAKAESNKRRSSETITVSTANVTRTGSLKDPHHRDKSNEGLEESHEECKYLGLPHCVTKHRCVHLSFSSLS
jgi:hypothetical protein